MNNILFFILFWPTIILISFLCLNLRSDSKHRKKYTRPRSKMIFQPKEDITQNEYHKIEPFLVGDIWPDEDIENIFNNLLPEGCKRHFIIINLNIS